MLQMSATSQQHAWKAASAMMATFLAMTSVFHFNLVAALIPMITTTILMRAGLHHTAHRNVSAIRRMKSNAKHSAVLLESAV